MQTAKGDLVCPDLTLLAMMWSCLCQMIAVEHFETGSWTSHGYMCTFDARPETHKHWLCAIATVHIALPIAVLLSFALSHSTEQIDSYLSCMTGEEGTAVQT